MNAITKSEEHYAEARRFRDEDIWCDKDVDGEEWQILETGRPRAYWQKTMTIDGHKISIRRPSSGPEGVTWLEFERVANKVFGNVLRVHHGIPIENV